MTVFKNCKFKYML